jgi:outer membrane protein assembly factor BamB
VNARHVGIIGATIGLGLLLAGCDWLPDYFGAQKKPPLPGERVSVLELEHTLSPDPKIADVEVRLPRPYVNPDWPADGGYPSHAMYHLQLGYDLKQAWRSGVGSGSDSEQRLTGQPVVADGKVFAVDSESNVSAFDAAGGKRLWQVDLTPKDKDSGAIGGGLAYDRGRLFVATAYGDIAALEGTSGKEVWRQHIGIPFRAGPTVSDSRVFAISYDNQVHALSAADGKVIWTYTGVAESAQLLGGASPAVEGGIVVAPLSTGELVALRADGGRTIWTDTLARAGRVSAVGTINDIAGSPVIDRGLVFAVSHSGRMVAIELASGERVWEQEIAGVQAPWIGGNFIYLVTADAEVICLARADGRVRWVRQLDRFEKPKDKKNPINWYGPVLASDRLVLLSSRGHALSVSPYTGELLGEIVISDAASLAPVVANGTLYILTDDARLVAFR